MKFSYKPLIPATLALAALSILGSGCAKSPSGGPTTPNALNRLTITMQVQAPVTRPYIYAFAFDDDDVSNDGPGAIVSSTTQTNGIVGGSFSVLVFFQGGQFIVYRRTDLGNGAEQLDRASSAFVTSPSRNGNTFTFSLNLDALTDSGVRLFKAGTQDLDYNFISTDEIRRDPNNSLPKTYDALGLRASNTYNTIDIQSTNTVSGTDAGGVNDVVTDDTTGAIDISQLNITTYTIAVQRST